MEWALTAHVESVVSMESVELVGWAESAGLVESVELVSLTRCISPTMAERREDFPLATLPTTPINSPLRTVNEMFFKCGWGSLTLSPSGFCPFHVKLQLL